jgi:hypothetical protein
VAVYVSHNHYIGANIMAGLTKEQKAAKLESELPESVTLASPYGYDPEIEGEAVRMWSTGQVVTDPEQIKDLIDRQAPLEE